MQSAKYKVQSAKCKVQSGRLRIEDTLTFQVPEGQLQIANRKSKTPGWRYLPPSATPVRWSDLAASLAAVRSAGAAAAFAANLKAMTGSPSVQLTASGRAAFFLILEACKRQRPGRDEVVLPAYTCPVLAYAARAAGL